MRSGRLLADESGATAIEYGLLAALVALVMLIGLTVFGNSVDALYAGGVSSPGQVIAEASETMRD